MRRRRREYKPREKRVIGGKEYLILYFKDEWHDGEYVTSVAICDEHLNHVRHSRSNGSWFKKEYVQLESGIFRVSKFMADTGYMREHHYDLKTGRVISEIDSSRNINLLDIRLNEIRSDGQSKNTETPMDSMVSLENEMKLKEKPNPKKSLF
jgi:hypothetical protein